MTGEVDESLLARLHRDWGQKYHISRAPDGAWTAVDQAGKCVLVAESPAALGVILAAPQEHGSNEPCAEDQECLDMGAGERALRQLAKDGII